MNHTGPPRENRKYEANIKQSPTRTAHANLTYIQTGIQADYEKLQPTLDWQKYPEILRTTKGMPKLELLQKLPNGMLAPTPSSRVGIHWQNHWRKTHPTTLNHSRHICKIQMPRKLGVSPVKEDSSLMSDSKTKARLLYTDINYNQ